MGAKLQFVLDSVSLPFFLRWRITLMNHKRQWKHRSPGKEAQLGWNVVPQRRATWGLCDCSEIRSLRCRDGSWLEIILDLHWALNPIWDKETRRGRPRREEERQESGSQKPKRRGLLARTAGRESVSSRLSLRPHTRKPPCWRRDLRALAPKLAEHTSLLLTTSSAGLCHGNLGDSHRGLNQQELCGLTGHPSSCYSLLRSKTRHQLNLSLLTLLAF